MSTKVAINGLGRIGRAILKLVIDEPSIELVAVKGYANQMVREAVSVSGVGRTTPLQPVPKGRRAEV
jgi:glyceraldehyde-3-phosphate dehydrogenase/erythrose-4-phosphate dehydrogenase